MTPKKRNDPIFPMFLKLLPFLGSGFVPVKAMPDGLHSSGNQPSTPIIGTLRTLLVTGCS